ncbi:MAG: magnesium and cobalt transport protein CorA [Firmicutes bacterium HGW-Firmicutes-15]|nr:MAG: magnesium and cobalt transport protein CorA [Firmicutes bacterium HGW-Firmicutes-15]
MIKTYFYSHEEDHMYHDIDLSATDDLLSSPSNLLWIDLYDCSESELHYVGNIFDFHPLALEDCLQESPRAKIDKYDDYHFFVFHSLRYFEEAEEEDEISSIELDVFLGANYIVTIHPIALSAVGKVARISLKDTEMMDRGPEYLLYKIVDNIVDDSFPIIERLGERIDDLEDNIFSSKDKHITEEILTLKRTIILLRKVLIPQRHIFANIRGRYSFFVNDDNVPYYLDLADNLNSILDTVNTYRDLVNSSMETYYSILSGRTSEIITILTIISIIMMPLTVITGFFGMNVDFPGREHPSMVWYILLGMFCLSLSMLGFFRYRKWV